MKSIFDYKVRFYTSNMNEICLHLYLLGILWRKRIGRENALKQHSGVVVIIEVDEKIEIVTDKPHLVLVPKNQKTVFLGIK